MEPKRVYQESTETEDYTESHPSYGMVGLSRFHVSGEGISLYGSAVKHGTAISLKIQTSVKRHQLSRDWISGDKTIVEVILSGNQLADLLTCMNVGDGVPCTISHHDGPVDQCPEENPRSSMQNRVDDHMAKLHKRVESLEQEVEEIMSGGKWNKETKERLRFLMLKIKQDVGTNFNYMKKTLNEYTDDMLTEAKGEFSAMVDSMIHSRGIEGLKMDGLIQIKENDESE